MTARLHSVVSARGHEVKVKGELGPLPASQRPASSPASQTKCGRWKYWQSQCGEGHPGFEGRHGSWPQARTKNHVKKASQTCLKFSDQPLSDLLRGSFDLQGVSFPKPVENLTLSERNHLHQTTSDSAALSLWSQRIQVIWLASVGWLLMSAQVLPRTSMSIRQPAMVV